MATGDKLPYGWEVEVELYDHQGQIRRKVEDKGLLSRSLTNARGEVVCGCDGTSRAVRACLASTLVILAPPNKSSSSPQPDLVPLDTTDIASLERTAGHVGTTKVCAMLGLERVAGTKK